MVLLFYTMMEVYTKFGTVSIIQQGTHAALLEDTGGEYAQLWNEQAQYYV